MQDLSSRAVMGMFYARLEQMEAASWIDGLSMYFDTDQESEDYKWLGQVPQMRKWIGGRNAVELKSDGVVIVNEEYEATLQIPVRWMRRDKTGQIMVRVAELATRAVTHWQKLLSELINNGESQVCYDGQFFFDTDHQNGSSGVQSNDLSIDISGLPVSNPGSPTSPGVEAMRDVIMQCVQQILGFKDDQGEPMNENGRLFTVMVPSTLFHVGAAAVNNPVVGGGDTNVITNLDGYNFRLVSNPRLTWTDKIAVFRSDGDAKALIRQEEAPGLVTSSLAEGSEHEFKHNEHLHGVSSSRAVGYGLWERACLATMI